MKGNIIGSILFYSALAVMIIGIILGFSMANVTRFTDGVGNQQTTMDWAIFINIAVRAIAGGLLLLGLSEIIKLLHSINSKTGIVNETTAASGMAGDNTVSEEQSTDWVLSKTDEEKIYDAYSNKAILEIIPSFMEGYCIVKLQEYDGPLDPTIKVVDIAGFGVREVKNASIKREILEWYKEQS